MKHRLPSASGNFFKDVTRVLGFLWTKHKARKTKKEGKVMHRLKQEFYK